MIELKERRNSDVGSDMAAGNAEPVCIPLDITDNAAVEKAVCDTRPDAVIHCAAWTAVDAAEDNEAKVHAVNADGTKHLAEACKAVGAKMLYISTITFSTV